MVTIMDCSAMKIDRQPNGGSFDDGTEPPSVSTISEQGYSE